MSIIIQEQYYRIKISKLLRILPDEMFLKGSDCFYSFDSEENLSEGDKISFLSSEFIVTISKNLGFRLWQCPKVAQILELLKSNSTIDGVGEEDLSILKQCFMIYSFGFEIFRLCKIIGDFLHGRGMEYFRNHLAAMKKEIQRIQFPLDLNRIANYFYLKWCVLRQTLQLGIFSSSFSSILNTEKELFINTHKTLKSYHERLYEYGRNTKLFPGTLIFSQFDLGSYMMCTCSSIEIKIFWEKINEVQ